MIQYLKRYHITLKKKGHNIMKTFEGNLVANENIKIGIVVARFNDVPEINLERRFVFIFVWETVYNGNWKKQHKDTPRKCRTNRRRR